MNEWMNDCPIVTATMIVQCAAFSKSLNPRNIDKTVSDIQIRIRFPFESSFWISVSGCKLTILPDIHPANRIVIISVFYTLLRYTNTAHSTKAEQRLCSEVLTSEVGLLNKFRAYKKWIPKVFQRVWKMFGFLIIRNKFWPCSTYSVKPL